MASTAESAVGSSYGEALMTTSAIVAEAVTGSHVLQIRGYSLTKGHGNSKFVKSSTFSVGVAIAGISGTTLMVMV